MTFSQAESQRLRFTRFLAISLILMTHIFQEYEIAFSAWANIGVEVFLVISGFIYGQKKQIVWPGWFARRFARIIPSYYTVLILTALAYWIFLGKNIIDLQYIIHFTTLHFLIFPAYPFWGGHLWYITAIVICYSILPLLLFFKKLRNIYFVILFFIFIPIFLLLIFYKTPLPYRLSGDIYCFISGFLVAHFFGNSPPLKLTISVIIVSLALMFFEMTAVANNFWNIPPVEKSIILLLPWKKCLYGISILLFLYLPVFDKISGCKIVNTIDEYSYDIYLAHKNFILGPLSLLKITNSVSFNILSALACSFICAFAVNKISGCIVKKMNLDVAGKNRQGKFPDAS